MTELSGYWLAWFQRNQNPKLLGSRALLISLGRSWMCPRNPSASSLCFRQSLHFAIFFFKSKIYRIVSREMQISQRKLEGPLFPRSYRIGWNLLRNGYEPRTGFNEDCEEGWGDRHTSGWPGKSQGNQSVTKVRACSLYCGSVYLGEKQSRSWKQKLQMVQSNQTYLFPYYRDVSVKSGTWS